MAAHCNPLSARQKELFPAYDREQFTQQTTL
jgi:hypothetical protein